LRPPASASRATAFVRFKGESVESAIGLDGYVLKGSMLRVRTVRPE
jgi:hypothetical protein